MVNIHDISENEKGLLNTLGKYPDASLNQLLTYTPYKWTSTVARKIDQFKKQKIIRRDTYDLDYGRLCTNPLHMLFCIVESNQSYNTVVSYLKLIEPFKWIYPVLSPHKELINVGFYSSDDAEMVNLLQVLKDNNIISDYIVRPFRHKRMGENPNFFGDIIPSLDSLLDRCDIPDMSLGHHDTDWSECDIALLPYLREGYKGSKLAKILRAEMNRGRKWTYEQMKYSREKMVRNGLIEKIYAINPFPLTQCACFNLFVKTDDISLTQRIIYNFGRGARLYREYVLCGDWGGIFCLSHPLFLTNLMHRLDSIDEIEERELYQIRSIPAGKYHVNQSLVLKYFDFEKQTLEYPYRTYREKIYEKLESEQY